MEVLQARFESFKKSKRVKNPNKSSSTTTLKWPHPSPFTANPETLAEAGFFYDPSYDDPDNVTCFYCGKQLAGWEEDDDPHIIHWNKCASTCCWAIVQCGLKVDMDRSGRFIFPDENRLPDSKAMEKARLETFKVGKGWIHDKNKNHHANSKSMARAGFVYAPQQSGDDLATCLYCNISLSGWDEEDDPLEEHHKRSIKSDMTCPFFGHSTAQQSKPPSRAPSQSIKPSSKPQSKPPSRSTSRTKYQDIVLPTKTFDGELEDDAPNSKTAPYASTTKTPAKSRSRSTSQKSSAKTPRSKSRSTSRASRSGLQGVREVEDEDEEEQPVEAPPTVKKKKVRSRSKSVARSQITAQSDGEEETPVAKTNRKPSRSRAKSRAPIEVESEEEEPTKSSKSNSKTTDLHNDEVTPDQPRRSARKSSKPKVVEDDDEEVVVTTAKKPSKVGKAKRTLSRSKSKAPPPVDEESQVEQEPDVTGPPPTMKTKVERIPDARDLFDDTVMDDYVPPPSSPPSTRREAPPAERLPIPIPGSSLPASADETSGDQSLPPPATENDKDGEKRKPGRPPKVKATPVSSQVKNANAGVTTTTKSSKPPSKQAKQVVEISSDEEDEELKPIVKTKKLEKKGSTAPPSASASQEKEIRRIEQSKPQDSTDVPMDSAQEAKHETATDVEMEVRTAPSTPPRPVQSTLVQALPEPHTPPPSQAVDIPDKTTSMNSGTTTTSSTITTEPLFVPPLSRLPFMPLHTLSEAELDMTVEEWIRYQIEVEQDRFKRDGKRELERFKQRAEEVRRVIEGL